MLLRKLNCSATIITGKDYSEVPPVVVLFNTGFRLTKRREDVLIDQAFRCLDSTEGSGFGSLQNRK